MWPCDGLLSGYQDAEKTKHIMVHLGILEVEFKA